MLTHKHLSVSVVFLRWIQCFYGNISLRCHSIQRNECSSECFTFLGDKCMLFEFQFGEKTSATRLLFWIKRDKCRYDLLQWLHTWYFALAWTSVCFWSADNVSKLILSHTPHMSRHTFFQMNLIQLEWVEKEKKNCLASTNIHWLCSECGTYSIMLLHQPFSVWKFGLTFSTLRDFDDGFVTSSLLSSVVVLSSMLELALVFGSSLIESMYCIIQSNGCFTSITQLKFHRNSNLEWKVESYSFVSLLFYTHNFTSQNPACVCIPNLLPSIDIQFTHKFTRENIFNGFGKITMIRQPF